MRCPDCGGKKYRRNMLDREFQELERQWMQGDLGAGARILRERMRMGEIPEDYVRRAAALGDARAEALGLEPWDAPICSVCGEERNPHPLFPSLGCECIREHEASGGRGFIELIGLPGNLQISFAIDTAERVLHVFEDEFPADPRPREALEAARLRLDYTEESWSERHDFTDEVSLSTVIFDAAFQAIQAAQAARDPMQFEEAASHAAHSAYSAARVASWHVPYPSGAEDDAVAAAADPIQERAWQSQRLIQYLLGEVQI